MSHELTPRKITHALDGEFPSWSSPHNGESVKQTSTDAPTEKTKITPRDISNALFFVQDFLAPGLRQRDTFSYVPCGARYRTVCCAIDPRVSGVRETRVLAELPERVIRAGT